MPIAITGHAKGAQQGGKFYQSARKLRISALMANLPDEVTVDITNTESAEYKSIEKNLLSEAQSKRFSDELEKWKSEVKVSLNNKYIDNYCRNYLGYTPQKKTDK